MTNLDRNDTDVRRPARRGPPNRMNDLPYREWMKFQKSFFWYDSDAALVNECIRFFTKSIWQCGAPSRTLLAGFADQCSVALPPRVIETVGQAKSIGSLTDAIEERAKSDERYDFLLIDLRRLVHDERTLDNLLALHSVRLFSALRSLLQEDRYCILLVETEGPGGGGFPLPWSVALAGREKLKLRDEKVGLLRDGGGVVYCLIMQASDDMRPPSDLLPASIHVDRSLDDIPSWTLPKPPPRTKHEILHPAKFPETLVQEFIERFSKPGEKILDPMAGTGSAVIAALRAGRHGYGVELVPEFVDIANARISREKTPVLFEQFELTCNAEVFQGDAARFNEIHSLNGTQFSYVITSPPYWSMLQNRGSEYQRERRRRNLKLVYSDDPRDMGNVQDYDEFVQLLCRIYTGLADRLEPEGVLTVIVKNVKREHTVYPLAWDLVRQLSAPKAPYDYVGTTLWCQDDVRLKPFAVGIHWVSNTLHQYCLHFRNRRAKMT